MFDRCCSSCFGLFGGLVLLGAVFAAARWLTSTPLGIAVLILIVLVVLIFAFSALGGRGKRTQRANDRKQAFDEGVSDARRAQARIRSGEIAGQRFVVTRPDIAESYAKGIHSVMPDAWVALLLNDQYKEL